MFQIIIINRFTFTKQSISRNRICISNIYSFIIITIAIDATIKIFIRLFFMHLCSFANRNVHARVMKKFYHTKQYCFSNYWVRTLEIIKSIHTCQFFNCFQHHLCKACFMYCASIYESMFFAFWDLRKFVIV